MHATDIIHTLSSIFLKFLRTKGDISFELGGGGGGGGGVGEGVPQHWWS